MTNTTENTIKIVNIRNEGNKRHVNELVRMDIIQALKTIARGN